MRRKLTFLSLNILLFCLSFLYPLPVSAEWCTPGNPTSGVRTALGCLQIITPTAFISQLLPWLMGMAGLIALLTIVYAGFLIITAGGDPKKITAGKEIIFTSITGLVFIALTVLLLNFIGVRILQLGPEGFH